MATHRTTITELRTRTAELVNAVEAGHHQRIERLGRDAAVVVPVDWYEYAAACVDRVHQLDACFNVNTIKAPRPKTPEENP
jgi:prevent-host-death family protein